MIKKITIENFLAFDHLEVEGFKRINLLTGRNNTGKTAFLEAIRIYKSGFDSSTINAVLENRGVNLKDPLRCNALYHRFGEGNNELKINSKSLKFDKDFMLKVNGNNFHPLSINSYIQKFDKNLTYLPFILDLEYAEEQWQQIVLTPVEDDVENIIRECIEPDLKRLNVSSKSILIRLDGVEAPVDIKTLGDGMKRIVIIAMALAASKDKILLIDELELGLHHSVIKKLWEIIFLYSKKWNIQVFATTHSSDTISSFRDVAENLEQSSDTQFIRLQRSRKNNSIEAILHEHMLLDTILDSNMEIR